MNILALETSTDICSVAVWHDGAIDARVAQAGQRNSEVLLPMVEALLTANKLQLKDMNGIAFGAGPGSFTGLRVACAVAQGLAFGINVPVAGISTLLAVAEKATEKAAETSKAKRVVVCLDARMGEVYYAAYEKHGDAWLTIHAPTLYKPEDVPALQSNDWIACGSGFFAYRDALMQRYADNITRVADVQVPHAKEIAVLAAREFAQGRGMPAAEAAPLYVRDKVALRVDERVNLKEKV